MGTGQLEGTVGHPGVEEAADVAECNEEGQLAQGRHRRLGVPFDMEPAAEGIDGDGARKRHPGHGFGVPPPGDGLVRAWASPFGLISWA